MFKDKEMTSHLSRDEAIFANKVYMYVHVAVTNIQMYMYTQHNHSLHKL